jgi:hypothetical protein
MTSRSAVNPINRYNDCHQLQKKKRQTSKSISANLTALLQLSTNMPSKMA